MKKLIYILCFIVFLISCQKSEDRICYKSTGKTISELRSLENFTVLVLTDNIALKLHQSIENSATITAGNNLINFIQTKVSGDTLYISNQNKCNNLRSRKKEVIVTVNVLNIQKIIHYGTKGISSNNTLKGDMLSIESFDGHGDVSIDFEGNYLTTLFHSGTSNVLITGLVNQSYAYQIGTGYTDYSGLEAKNCFLHSRSIQDCIMSAKENLEVEIHSSGNVYYQKLDNLSVGLTGNGTGELIAE